MKQLHRIVRKGQFHGVGDGFPVRTLFFYGMPDTEVDPILLPNSTTSSRSPGFNDKPSRQ
ncbi:MAG: hypothetical protein ACR65R_05925 [Methylomicrobium sp.]